VIGHHIATNHPDGGAPSESTPTKKEEEEQKPEQPKGLFGRFFSKKTQVLLMTRREKGRRTYLRVFAGRDKGIPSAT